MRKIGVQLVDGHAVFRAGMKALISRQPDMEVVGEAGDAAGAVIMARTCCPAVVLLEIGLPDSDGTEVIAKILEAAPRAKVLILSMHDDPFHLRRALVSGAAGYVAKRVTDTEVMIAIRAIAGGQAYANVSLTARRDPEKLGLSAWNPEVVKTRLDSLSPREKDALALLTLGYTNKEIASRLNLSVKSVETYRRRVSGKLGAAGRADLVRFAIKAGLFDSTLEKRPETDSNRDGAGQTPSARGRANTGENPATVDFSK